MTRAKTPAQKLQDALTKEYKKDGKRWEDLRSARLEQFNELHYTQKKAIWEAIIAWRDLEACYGELCSPSFDDICKAQQAINGLLFHFNLNRE